MALCVMNPIDMNYKKIDKCALKLLGIGRFELTDEEILECVAKYTEPRCIEGLLFDTFNNYYVLFLSDINSTCSLIGKKIEFKTFCINIYPLLECYLIDNVYPCLKNEELRDIFGTFGNVFSVTNHHLVPSSSKFSHVLSGKREITFLLPGEELEIYIPINVMHPPYSFNVKKFCCACLTEGHSLLYCPDIDDDNFKEKKIDCSDSDGELDAIIKAEDIDFEDSKIHDSIPDTQPANEISKQREEPENAKVNSAKGDEIRQDKTCKDVDKGKSLKSKVTDADNLTEVVSTSKVCRFTPGIQLSTQHETKKSDTLFPPLAEDLINETCGSFIIEANVFKQLLLMDGRYKAKIIKFAYNYLIDDISHLLKLLKNVLKCCSNDKKYACLRGPFTSKVKRIHAVLLSFSRRQ